MKINKNKSLLVITIIAALGLTACSDDKAENAGEKIDNVMSNTGDSIKDAAKDAGNAIEDACENVKEGIGAKDKDC